MMRYQGLSPDNLPLSNGRKSHWRSCKEDEGITTNTRQIDDENDVEPHKGVPKSRSPSSKLGQDQNFSTYSTTNSLPKSNHDMNNNNTTPLHNGGGSGDMLLQWGHRKRSRNRSATAAGAAANGSALADDSSSSSWTQLQAMLKVPRRSITLSPHATATAELIETKNSSDTNIGGVWGKPNMPIMPPPSSVSSNLISRTASAAAVTTNSSTANGKVGNHKSPTKDGSSFVNRRNLDDRSGSGSGSHPTRNGGSNSKGVMAASSSRSKVVKRSPQKVVGKNDRTTGCSSVTASLRDDDDKTNGLSRQEQEVGGLETSHYKNNIGSSLPQETGCSNATTNTNNNHEDIGRIKIVGGAAAVNEVYEWPRVHIPLTRKEKEEDFLLMKGTKLPHRPKKRPKAVDRMLQYCYPGAWLADVTKARYEVKEKKCTTKKPKRRGLKGMESMESDSE